MRKLLSTAPLLLALLAACGAGAAPAVPSTAPGAVKPAAPASQVAVASAANPNPSVSTAANAASSNASAKPSAAASAAPAVVKIATNSGTAPTGWPLYVAKAKGFLAGEGITVETTPVSSDATQIQALIAGDVNVSISGITLVTAVKGGAPIKFVGSAQETPNFQLIVGKDIKTWSDLKGKTLAAGVTGSYFEVLLRGMLAANGLNKGDYQVLSMASSSTRIAALASGQISGTLLSIPEENKAIEQGFKSLGYVNDTLHDMQYNGYVVSGQWAQANSGTLVSFLTALKKATNWLFDPANKAEAMRIYGDVSKLSQSDLDQAYGEMIGKSMLSRDLKPNAKGIQNYFDLAISQGLDKSSLPPTDSWLDLTYVDQVKA
jgi:ABC-type nitrate/sulfonate/bicarbonate transport system substrate-binding protein